MPQQPKADDTRTATDDALDADEERRQNELAQKSESMARELSQKREMRIRQERVRHLSSDEMRPPPRTPGAGSSTKEARRDDRGRTPPMRELRDTRPLPAPTPRELRPSILDDVAGELEELLRDMRGGYRRLELADKITLFAAFGTFAGTLMPWVSTTTAGAHSWQVGLTSGGVLHALLAVAAVALLVGRGRSERGSVRLSGRERLAHARRASLWHLVIGFSSTFLCVYFLLIYGAQRAAQNQLEIRYGLYVTLAMGMGLAYGGFSRFWTRT